MQKDIRFQALIDRVRHPAFLLFLFGTISLILGALFAAYSDFSSLSLMRQAVLSPVSIVTSLAAQLLPFLIAAYAASISRHWLLRAVCCCKLFSLAYTGALVYMVYYAAGWLVRFLFLFSDIILVPCLCWYCFRYAMGECDGRKDLYICIGITVLTALFNCLFISPFLVKIM